MSVREIQAHLLELCGLQVSPDLISTIADEVLRLKIRDAGKVKNKAVYLVLGIRADGRKEVLELWIEQTEGAKFWLKVVNELKNRGLDDILIAVVDACAASRKRLKPCIHKHQTCIVHLIRNSLNLVSWKDRKRLAAALKPDYEAAIAEAAASALEAFANSEWWQRFPTVAAMWQRQWEQVIPFFAYPQWGAKSFIPPMTSRAYTCSYARSSRTAAISERRSRQQTAVSYYTISKKIGRCLYDMEVSGQLVRHPVCGTIHQRHELIFKPDLSHRISDTVSPTFWRVPCPAMQAY